MLNAVKSVLADVSSVSPSSESNSLLWRRASTRNVSQHTLYGIHHIHINLTLIHCTFKKKSVRSLVFWPFCFLFYFNLINCNRRLIGYFSRSLNPVTMESFVSILREFRNLFFVHFFYVKQLEKLLAEKLSLCLRRVCEFDLAQARGVIYG